VNGDNLQKAIYNKLTGDETLTALITGVYADVQQPDEPESESLFPYVTIGQDNLERWDTKTDFGVNALCQIDVWSRQNNYLEVKKIASNIYSALHAKSLTIPEAEHVLTRVESEEYTIDEDGHTKRGLMLVRVIYDEI